MADWFYVCDRCGDLREKSERAPSLPAGEDWLCESCGARTGAWEFTDREKARQHSWTILDKKMRREGFAV